MSRRVQSFGSVRRRREEETTRAPVREKGKRRRRRREVDLVADQWVDQEKKGKKKGKRNRTAGEKRSCRFAEEGGGSSALPSAKGAAPLTEREGTFTNSRKGKGRGARARKYTKERGASLKGAYAASKKGWKRTAYERRGARVATAMEKQKGGGGPLYVSCPRRENRSISLNRREREEMTLSALSGREKKEKIGAVSHREEREEFQGGRNETCASKGGGSNC